MICPNTSGIFHDFSPQVRQRLFYFVCVPTRLTIAYLVAQDSTWIPYVVLFASATIVKLLYDILYGANQQWWSKELQFIMACAIVACYFIKQIDMIPQIMLVSVLLGVFQSFQGFC